MGPSLDSAPKRGQATEEKKLSAWEGDARCACGFVEPHTRGSEFPCRRDTLTSCVIGRLVLVWLDLRSQKGFFFFSTFSTACQPPVAEDGQPDGFAAAVGLVWNFALRRRKSLGQSYHHPVQMGADPLPSAAVRQNKTTMMPSPTRLDRHASFFCVGKLAGSGPAREEDGRLVAAICLRQTLTTSS
ncbi:hypothetical protein VTK26DRAFT_8284 [Humicola hyalothermophila]